MAAAARPFDFNAFDAPAPVPASPIASAPETTNTYTQRELDLAVAQARKDAVKSIVSGETLKQTALLESIARRLTDATVAEIDRVADHIDTLTDVAEAIVTEFCITCAATQQTEAVTALLDQYLHAASDGAGATLVLPAKTPKRGRTQIEKALADRGGDHIAIATDAALSPGELRIEWRGGKMTRTHDAIAAQIKDIFAATKISQARQSLKKEIAP